MDPSESRAKSPRRTATRSLAFLFLGLLLTAVTLILGFRDRTQSVLVDRLSTDIDSNVQTVVGQEEPVLTCPGPFASMKRMGAYYPVNGRLVWPTDGYPQPMPCEHNRIWLQLTAATGVFLASGIVVVSAVQLRKLNLSRRIESAAGNEVRSGSDSP